MTHVPIVPDKEYNPSEIASNGWIKNTKNKNDYKYILRLIKYGKLRARNVCLTGKKYFKVLGSDIIRYKHSSYTVSPIDERQVTTV
jgi:hypothetical protein